MTAQNASRKTAAKKVTAAKAEAEGKPVSFEFKGMRFEIPTDPRHLPLELLMTDDEVEATRIILGEDQWNTFVASKPTVGDFYDLVDAMSEARGRNAEAGN